MRRKRRCTKCGQRFDGGPELPEELRNPMTQVPKICESCREALSREVLEAKRVFYADREKP